MRYRPEGLLLEVDEEEEEEEEKRGYGATLRRIQVSFVEYSMKFTVTLQPVTFATFRIANT
jgi:hypothetical protein